MPSTMGFRNILIILAIFCIGVPLSVSKKVGKAKKEKCGSSGSRILGGIDCHISYYPWMVGLMANSSIFCGGALLSDRYILTAAHCFLLVSITCQKTRLKDFISGISTTIIHFSGVLENVPPYRIEVRIGITRQRESAGHFIISNVTRHSKFHAEKLHNDIALIKLEKPVKFSRKIQPICLPDASDDFMKSECTAAGWGRVVLDGDTSNNLKKVTLKLVDFKACKKMLAKVKPENSLYEGNICAGGLRGKDTCEGDSGGPLFIKHKGRNKIVGIVSWGEKCGLAKVPGVYTNVQHFLKWIKKHTGPITCQH